MFSKRILSSIKEGEYKVDYLISHFKALYMRSNSASYDFKNKKK